MSKADGLLSIAANQGDHAIGPADAPATLVEYGDFECPHCRRAEGVVAELLERVGDGVLYVFRNFPLTTIHSHAQHAAEAAEAAGSQGRYWEMHRSLFAHADDLSDESLVAMAQSVGLDVDRFMDEMKRHVNAARVRADFMGGVRSGVNGTPTFFVNSRRVDGGFELATLLEAVAQARG